MTIWKPSGKLLVGAKEITIDAPIINYTEGPKWDASSLYCQSVNGAHSCTQMAAEGGQMPWSLKVPRRSAKRYSSRPALRGGKWGEGERAPYEAVRPLIKQFVFHHDGCATSAMCFDVLQNERGFSCHFLIDNDGTIYQTLNLALMAFHAANANTNTIGVELCNRGDAKKEPNYYSGNRFGPQRREKPCKINGHTYLAFDYTDEQYMSLGKLSKALTAIFPNLPAEYPQKSPGVQTWDTMPESASAAFSGFIGHYHLTQRKWDPGFFDFSDFCRKLRGDFCYVVWPEPPAKDAPVKRPVIPGTKSEVEAGSAKLFAMNEGTADAGFFPVGPWGESRLWHGGVHLTGDVGFPVFAPFPGRVVAVRMGPNTPVGSTNFVLLRHQLSLGERKVEFYTLYMHLGDEPTLKAEQPAAWLESDGWKKGGTKFDNGVVGLDDAVEAGSVIGHINTAGPDDLSRAQVHVELFSKSDLFPEGSIPNSPWKVVDGSGGGRFCDADEIIGLIDKNADDMLQPQEIKDFYGAGSAAGTRYFVTYNVSEWTYEPSWPESLKLPKDLADKKPDEIDAQYEEQIKPGLWWSGPVAQHAKLPPDGIVYHYHPVAFVSWFNVQMREAQAAAKKAGTNDFKKELAQETPDGVTDDLNDVDGSSMKASTDDEVDPCNDQITLKELVEGFDAPECGDATP